MGTRYSSTTVSSYNSSPPADDGSTTAANKVTWATIKTKLGDPLNTWATALNSAVLNALDFSASAITGTYTTVAADNARVLQCAGTFTLSLGDAATLAAGWCTTVKVISGTVTIGRATGGNTLDGVAANIVLKTGQSATFAVNQTANGFNCISSNPVFTDTTDPTKQLVFALSNLPTATQLSVATGAGTILPAGLIMEYAGSAVPTGWLPCDGAAVSRTTFAALFSAISTTWGVGDGSTTFNTPDKRGRVAIGDGTGTFFEAATASSGNGFTVVSNATKWVTGQSVILSNLTGFTTTATAGPTYFVVRISSTNIRLATTLALSQNLTPDITISGGGTVTITGTLTARTLGQNGGEESHAMSSTELLAHVHGMTGEGLAVTGGGINTVDQNSNFIKNTNSAGGNAAMNVMQPFVVSKFIIST